MSTVLTNGIIIPDNGSRNWGGDLANNWDIIDVNVGYMTDVKNKVTTLENSVAENTANIQINASNISALQTSKANDIDVVHKSGDVISGDLLGSGSNNLGTSTNKWKTINSVGPGALSLPACGEYVDVTSEIVNTNGTFQYTNNFYDGWLVVTAVADLFVIANQDFECRAIKSADDVVTTHIALRVNETASMRFSNFSKFVYVHLHKCFGTV